MELKIPPDFGDDDIYRKRNLYWDLSKNWFLERGYHLYKRAEPDDPNSLPAFTSSLESNPGEDPYPFAYIATMQEAADDYPQARPHLAAFASTALFAQDSQRRHVVLKPIKIDTVENRILRSLCYQQQTQADSGRDVHIIPILGFLDADDGCHSFVVMPRWGDSFYSPIFQHVYEVFDFFHAMLKALNFLHSLKIVHHDISLANILVNHVPAWDRRHLEPKRAALREQQKLRYALFDFNVSLSFPLDATAEQCRLPYWGSYTGDMIYQPPDTQQGEHDYDPFAFDVGCLGLLFCDFAQTSTPIVPLLAPFLDRMITRDIPNRFIIAQALEFFENMQNGLSNEQRMTAYPGRLGFNDANIVYESRDRWQGLPAAFVKQWSHFREPPVPLSTQILRRICRNQTFPWAHLVVVHVRKFFAFLVGFVKPR